MVDAMGLPGIPDTNAKAARLGMNDSYDHDYRREWLWPRMAAS